MQRDTGRRKKVSAAEQNKWVLAHASWVGEGCLLWPFSRITGGYGMTRCDGRGIAAHRAMCEAAHGQPPSEKHEVAHSCGNGRGGCVNPKHLRWATHAENCADKLAHGTDNRGEKHNAAKLSELDVEFIFASYGKFNQYELADMLGVTQGHVNNILCGRSWRHVWERHNAA